MPWCLSGGFDRRRVCKVAVLGKACDGLHFFETGPRASIDFLIPRSEPPNESFGARMVSGLFRIRDLTMSFFDKDVYRS
jgi:hypothetical protein